MKSYADKNGKNGPAAGSSKAARLQSMRNAKTEQPDWARINMDLIQAAIAVVTKDDGALQFGLSRDGGAYAVRLYSGGSGESSYFHSDAEVTQHLNDIWEAFRE